MPFTIKEIIKNNLCTGCGLCTASCPDDNIAMEWKSCGIWNPVVSAAGCTQCGKCYEVCPQSPEVIAEYAGKAAVDGEKFGLKNANYFISFDLNADNRMKSASGGVVSLLLTHLLKSHDIDGVLCSTPLCASIGNPHYSLDVITTAEQITSCRSSHYHPLTYHDALKHIKNREGSYVLVGVPCVVRGIKLLPRSLREKIKFSIALACSHNVTGAFIDQLARQQGITRGERFFVNLRDKLNIPDADNFNIFFKLADREIRKNRFLAPFTSMWRNYFFALESCLYCPDFYGADADLSVKDAWGRLSKDPRGISLLVVRNRMLLPILEKLHHESILSLEPCNEDEVYNSQPGTAVFKHRAIKDRIARKKAIWHEVNKNNQIGLKNRRLISRHSLEYFRLLGLIKVSRFCFTRFGAVPVNSLIFFSNFHKHGYSLAKETINFIYRSLRQLWLILKTALKIIFRFLGLLPPQKSRAEGKLSLKVLIAGGYGYGNIGDEAQLAANIQHWKKAAPGARITVLTPDVSYTQKTHPQVSAELAPRTAFFGWGDKSYFGNEKLFKKLFFPVAALLLFNARLMRAGLPVFGVTARQARLLDELHNADVLFLSGGGYLTGMTLSRLWDHMLLMRLADLLGVPTILSGQTIGVFKDRTSRSLSRWGFKKAQRIYLRDPEDSGKALEQIGVPPSKFKSTFDDALYYKVASKVIPRVVSANNGFSFTKPYIAVNVHYWGQSPDSSRDIMQQIAGALDSISASLDVQVAFIPMSSSDEAAIHEAARFMQQPSATIAHGYDIDAAIDTIRCAAFCLTMKHHPIIFAMGGSVPTIAMAFDDYYFHKNKGALKIFDMENCLIQCAPEHLGAEIIEKMRYLFDNQQEIRKKIAQTYKALEPMAGEVIYAWLREKNL